MDPGAIGVFIPIAAIGAWAWVQTAKLKANAKPAGADPEISARMHALEDEIGALRQELSETQERVDFAERLLAQRDPGGLNPPR
jgi:hypothetical protein